MPIKLHFAGRPPIELSDEQITLGSDPANTVNIPAGPTIRPNHAVIRLIDGRWIIEVRDAESFFVTGTGQKKAHWLNSGNVIRFADDGPVVKIELSEEVAPLSEAEPVRRNQRDVSKSEEALSGGDRPRVRPSDVILLPDSDDEIPVADAPLKLAEDRPRPSGANIDFLKPPKSGSDSSDQLPPPTVTIRASKAPTSTTIPVIDSAKSGTVRTPRSASGEIPTSRSASKSGKTDSNIPAKSPRRSASSAQIPVTRSDPNEAPAGTPVLKRLSSWEAPVPKNEDDDDMLSVGETIGRRRKGNDADVEWIKMVVLRCAGVGLVVLLAWLCVRELWKAMTPVNHPVPTVSVIMTDAHRQV